MGLRSSELKASVNEAEEAVENFRRSNDLRTSQGELASARSMSQVDTQLRDARQRLIAAESRYNQMLTGGNDSNAMQSTTLAALRTQYAILKQQSDEYARIYGARHPRLVSAQQALASLNAEINAEMARLTKAAQNEYDQAMSVVKALEKEVTEVSADVFTENDAQIRLRELTREASARTAVYEAFLSRARLTAEREQVDTTNIRVISAPIAPRTRSWPPNIVKAAIFGLVLGLTLGSFGVLVYGIIVDTNRAGRPTHTEPEPRHPIRRREAADSVLSSLSQSSSSFYRR